MNKVADWYSWCPKLCSWVLWGSWTETEDQASRTSRTGRTGRTGRTLASKQNWLSTFTFWGISLILTFSESKICGTTCKCVDLAIRNFNANNHGKPLSTKRCGEQFCGLNFFGRNLLSTFLLENNYPVIWSLIYTALPLGPAIGSDMI